MEVIDKRKHLANGEANPEAIEVAVTQSELTKFLAEVPRTYEDPKPRANFCLVKQGQAATVYKGTTFHIPETAQQSPNEGVVVAVGKDVEEIAPGDLVTFGRFNAEPIEIEGQTYQLVSIHDIKLFSKVHYAILGD